MPGNSVIAGPFQGGLSTYSDPTSIQDNELVVCDNFDIDMDGSLKSRPPFVDRGVTFPLATTGNMRILGYYYVSAGNVNSNYVVASDGNSSTYYFDGSSWHLITSSLSAVSMVQYNGQLWLVAPTGVCGYWTPTGGWVADDWCPNGESITVYKSRMYVAAGASAVNRTLISSGNTTGIVGTSTGWVPDVTDIYYSAVLGLSPWKPITSGTNPPQSPGISVFKVNAGDGQATVALLNTQGTFYIFRTASIWTFSYASDPKAGVVASLVPNIGLADSQALLFFENYIYFMFDGKAYTLFSGLANLFNPKVPFVAGSRTGVYQPFAVSVFNRRIIFTYYDTMYVYSLRSQNWTTWHAPAYGSIGKIVQFSGALTSDTPVAVTSPNVSVAPGGTRTAKLLYLTDAFTDEVEAAPYICSMQTKTVDYGAPTNYKRLFWWAVDATYRSGLVAKVVPEVFSYQVTWGQILAMGRTWGSMRSYTWGNPSAGDLSASTQVSGVGAGLGPLRKTIRLNKNMRFKQAYYTVALTVDGSSKTCPARIFLLETFVLVKDRVSRTVS
jgi:hypothetical protein